MHGAPTNAAKCGVLIKKLVVEPRGCHIKLMGETPQTGEPPMKNVQDASETNFCTERLRRATVLLRLDKR